MAIKELEKGKRYQIDFRDQQRRRVREIVQGTKTEARDVLNERKQEVWRAKNKLPGGYVNPRHVDEARGPTFKEFATQFMKDYGRQRRSTYYADALRPTGPIMTYFGTRRLREITEADLDQFRAERALSVSSSTVRKNLTVLGTMFRQAKRWGEVAVNPASDLQKPSEPKHKVRFLTTDEWKRLEVVTPPWLCPILRMAVATGMRLGEITGLRWEDVDGKAKLIHVPTDSKTGTRAIPINETAAEVLDSQVRHVRSPYVFVDSTGQHYHDRETRNTVSKRTKAAMKRAGLTDCTFHVLRHTAASWMVQAGRPLAEVKDILGHATMQTTLRYAHLQPEHLRDSMTALDNVLKGAVGR